MPDIKLARLPDRTPVKLSIVVAPDLHEALIQYTSVYAETYGRHETIADLVPVMLSAFLDADRGFQRARTKLRPAEQIGGGE